MLISLPGPVVERRLQYASGFRNQLKRLARRQPGLSDRVDGLLRTIAGSTQPPGSQIQGLDGRPVFKVRLPFGGKGKRTGARLIYYRDEECVVALFLYSKGDLTDIPVKEIREALAPYP